MNFLGFVLLWFCFSCVWILLAPRDGTNLWRSRIKEDSLQKPNTFLHIVCFICLVPWSYDVVLTMDALEGRMPKMQGFKLSGCGCTICLLCRSSIVGELELDRSVVV